MGFMPVVFALFITCVGFITEILRRAKNHLSKDLRKGLKESQKVAAGFGCAHFNQMVTVSFLWVKRPYLRTEHLGRFFAGKYQTVITFVTYAMFVAALTLDIFFLAPMPTIWLTWPEKAAFTRKGETFEIK